MPQNLCFLCMQSHVKSWGHEKVLTNHCSSGCSRTLLWLHNHEGALGTGVGLAHHTTQINHCTKPSKPRNHPACTFWKILGLLLPLGRSFTHSPSQGADLYLHFLHLGDVLQHSTWQVGIPWAFLHRWSQAALLILCCLGLFMPFMTKDVVCGGCQERGRALEAPHANEEWAGSESSCLRGSMHPHTFHVPAKANLSWQL